MIDIKHIIELENRLCSKEVRANSGLLDKLLHENFSEFGKSGRAYTKEMILQELPTWRFFEYELIGFEHVVLSENCVLLKYQSDAGGIKTNRSSVWVLEDCRWQMLHHQGTIYT